VTLGTHATPDAALERAMAAAYRAVATRMLVCGYDPHAMTTRALQAGYDHPLAEFLGQFAAEVATDACRVGVEAAWPVWKHSISAWQRPPTERTP